MDLKLEGGDCRGRIIAKGSPEKVVKAEESYTGRYLKDVLEQLLIKKLHTLHFINNLL